MSSDNLLHDERMAQLQRVLDRLEQVTHQAAELKRTADELHREAAESIKLVKAAAADTTSRAKRTRKRKGTQR